MKRRHGMPEVPNNAEESIKCKQCGNIFGVADTLRGNAATCPMCGAKMDVTSCTKMGASNEEY